MEQIAHCSNEETPHISTTSRTTISSKKSNSEGIPSELKLKTPSKLNQNDEEQVLYVQNLSSPEFEKINEYGFRPSSSGSEETKSLQQEKTKEDNAEKNSESEKVNGSIPNFQNNKVRFNGETQFIQYCSAKDDKNRVTFVKLFDANQYEDDESDIPNKKRKLCFGYDELEPDCKSYRLFTDVHQLKVMKIIEDCFVRLADDGVLDQVFGMTVNRRMQRIREMYNEYNSRNFSCKRFLLPWLMVKIIQIILLNIMLFTFVNEGTYFTHPNKYLPVVVTFYLTLFLMLATILTYISCFTYSLFYNPFYMWSVIASSILTLMSTTGIFIMLYVLGYTSSYLQVTVVFLSGSLISCIIGELFLCYFELKRSINQIGHAVI